MRRVHLTVRRRALVGCTLAAALTAIAGPARAGSPPDLGTARQNLSAAQQQARLANTALGAAEQQLAGARQQLASVRARLAMLDQTISTDAARAAALSKQVSSDKTMLAAYIRTAYKTGGSQGELAYIIGAASLGDAFQRASELDRVNQAGDILLTRITGEEQAVRQSLADATAARAAAQVASQQALTAEAVVAIEADQLQAAAAAANQTLSTAKSQYTAAQQAAAAAAAAKAAAQGHGTVYPPLPGSTFTIDTDLTKPSGESAATLDAYLSGTALAGLGTSFVNAERSYHVSARYLTAHAILESAWGTSAIAHDKHNLFGYGADDANPYVDAMTFASFDACIQYVAQKVYANYLSPSGAFYHGPTLRGMNVDYASDPLWASKVARIADTIP